MNDKVWLNAFATPTDYLAKHLAVAHAVHARQHLPTRLGSGRQLLAALTATRGQDRTAGACTHPETEAMLFGAATVIWLISALAHNRSSLDS